MGKGEHMGERHATWGGAQQQGGTLAKHAAHMRQDAHDRVRRGGAGMALQEPTPSKRRPRGRAVAAAGVILAVVLVLGSVFAFWVFRRDDPPKPDVPASTPASHAVAEVVSPADTPAADSAPESVEVRLAMVGDILQHRYVWESGLREDGTYRFDHIFAHIGAGLEGTDIRVVNQETPLGGSELGFSGYPSFNGPQEMGDAEVAAGFNVVLRASNHAMDAGYTGLHNELAFWRGTHPEVAVIGAVDPDDAAAGVSPYEGFVWEGKGMRVALLNFTYDLNGYEDPNGAVALLDEWHKDQVVAGVSAADAEADVVVVFPHWGTEYQLTADDNQRAWAQALIEAGADVIIGGHPHVIEPFEVLTASDGRQVPCFWSVGNFVSTQNDNENLVGCLAQVVLRKEVDGTTQPVHCEFLPTVTHKGLGEHMTTYLLRDYTDELASTNGIDGHSWNLGLTQAWADEFCRQVLGEGYDVETHQLIWDRAAE